MIMVIAVPLVTRGTTGVPGRWSGIAEEAHKAVPAFFAFCDHRGSSNYGADSCQPISLMVIFS